MTTRDSQGSSKISDASEVLRVLRQIDSYDSDVTRAATLQNCEREESSPLPVGGGVGRSVRNTQIFQSSSL